MAQVTVVHHGVTIRISSKDQIEQGSLDLTIGNWPEMAWHPAEVKAALAVLHAQPYNPKRVNCQQGQNRSPTMGILYLWWQSGRTLGEAYDAVVAAYAVAQAELGEKKIKQLLEQLLGGYCNNRRYTWNDVRGLLPGQAAPLLP